MKIFLVYPHLVLVNAQAPHLAIPQLASYLKWNSKHEVTEIDLNINIINNLLKSASVKNPGLFLKSLLSRHELLFNSQEAIEKLVRENIVKYLRLHGIVCNNSPSIIDSYWQIANEDITNTIEGKKNDPFLSLLGANFFEGHFKKDFCLIGLSISYITQFLPALSIAKTIKQINPNAHIVFGGNTIRLIEKQILETPALFSIVDSFVVAEGEESMARLADALENKVTLRNVPNLISLLENKIEKTNESAFNIKNAVSPDFNILEKHNYLYPRLFRKLTLSVRASVGCYWNKCAFCTLSLRQYQERSISQVLDDISVIVDKYRPSTIRITDLSVSMSRLSQIAEGLIQRRLRIKWEAFARLNNHFTVPVCRLLSRSGCAALMFGLEAGSQRVEELMNKGHDLNEIPVILKNLHRVGIFTSLSAIVGFPSETEEDVKKTIDFLKTNSKNISSIGLSPFGLNYRSDVFNHPEKYGVKNIIKTDGQFFRRNFQYEVDSGISSQQAHQYVTQFRRQKWESVWEKTTRFIFMRFQKV